jgi:5-methylcytosine-specific restriction endonuclease McrA
MRRLSPIKDPQLEYEAKNWWIDENRCSYVETRMANCHHMQALDLREPRFLCVDCFTASVDGIFVRHRQPDICSATWKRDFARELDEGLLTDLKKSVKANPRCALECAQCLRKLRPWRRESIYVQSRELQLDISDEVHSIEPSDEVSGRIIKLYGGTCFGCGRKGRLHIDHIQPCGRGGGASFRNLQPLCDDCGQRKADQPPAQIVMFLPMP